MDAEKDNQNRWRKLKDVFNEAVELAPESRASYLAALRLNGETLYQELAELIDVDREAEDFLGEPVSLESDAFSSSPIGETVGHYKIVREIERGGMGAVFEAVRFDGEFEQRVAVKLVNRHFFSGELVKRFRKERQILAKLEHPNIVRLLDGGVTEDKTPYYVMEFIEGTPINVYCRENDLDTDRRVELFLQVCEAVAYAHRQLIVHRDLKPSNILVTKNEQAKLLDFGIAKILEADTDAQTQTQNAPLTPAYASPEQIKGETITTASDVFSLGAILYELLTEKSPYEIYGVGRMEILRGICEIEPKPPSALNAECEVRNADLKNNPAANGKRKRTPHFAFRTSHLNDLDNIVLKALRKEKEQRYASVEQFADDIKNYLNGLPVKAHPQSFKYLAAKFIKRNRLAVSLAAIAVVLIIGGVVAALWQSFEARRHQQIAEQRFNQVRKIANSLIFDYHDEISKLEGTTKLREKLVVDAVNYLNAVSKEAGDNAELLKETAIAYRKIGDVQGKPYTTNLGKLDEALISYQKSADLLGKAVSLAPADIALKDESLKSYDALAQAVSRSGDKPAATRIIEKAIAFGKQIPAAEKSFEQTLFLLQMRVTLGDAAENTPKKLEVYQLALADADALYPSRGNDAALLRLLMKLNQRTGSSLLWLGENEEMKGNGETAHDYYRQALERHRQALEYIKIFASLNPDERTNRRRMFVGYINVAEALIKLRDYDEALKNLEIASDINRASRKADPDDRESMLEEVYLIKNKQEILAAQGNPDEALKEIDRGLDLAEQYLRLEPSNIDTLWWICRHSVDAIKLLREQKKEKEIDKYQQIFLKFEKQYKDKSGKNWDYDS
ncbi:MAG: protein kinase [Acidobacteriota bacterium]|nr:protein kinase [Acidobacteriota bacterium]